MMFKIEKVLISDAIDQAAIDILRERNVHCDYKPAIKNDQLVEIIKDYDALIVRSGTQVTKQVIEASVPRLKLIGRAGVGVDNIDLSSATKHGIVVINAPSGNTISAVELTCAMILSCARFVPQACGSLKSGVWDRKSYMGNELKGKTLAIIGLGRIGREVACRMQSFHMKTIGFDPIVSQEDAKQFGVESMSLDEIWPKADFITVHTPLIEQTKNLINAKTLSQCKKGVRIINVARGGIVNENDLLQALQSGHCAGAALDVFQEEPPLNTELVKHANVVCTPHLGASTKEAQNNVAIEIAQQFLQLMDGQSVPGVVNAPLLSQMLKHCNLGWTRLGENIGKLAAEHSGDAAKSFTVTVAGSDASKVAKLIRESVLVGILTVRTKSKINLISASQLAESMQITANLQVGAERCCFGSVMVETDSGHRYKAIPQGRRCYLTQLDENVFESVPVAMHGWLTVIMIKQDATNRAEIMAEIERENDVQSVTRANNNAHCVCVHSSQTLNISDAIRQQTTFINQIQF